MEAEVDFKPNRRKGIPTVTPEDFWKRIVKPEGCWLYDGAKEVNGYGYLSNPLGNKPKFITAHKLAWILTNGPVPEGKSVLHSCDVRACVNPAHLRLGTHQENMDDMLGRHRRVTKLTADQVREIRQRLSTYPTDRRLPNGLLKNMGAEYGVTDKTIWEIRTNPDKWRHAVPHPSKVEK